MDAKPKVTEYVLGFAFNQSLSHVVLIRKLRPNWQAGRLNGVGGHTEDGESSDTAMAREFCEEVGVGTLPSDWQEFAVMEGGDRDSEEVFRVRCFCSKMDLSAVHKAGDEEPETWCVFNLSIGNFNMLDNVFWLVGLAYNVLSGNRPKYTSIQYHCK